MLRNITPEIWRCESFFPPIWDDHPVLFLWMPIRTQGNCYLSLSSLSNSRPVPGHHHPPLHRGGYMRSPSWTRCSKGEQTRERKHHSDSDSTEPYLKMERPKHPWQVLTGPEDERAQSQNLGVPEQMPVSGGEREKKRSNNGARDTRLWLSCCALVT